MNLQCLTSFGWGWFLLLLLVQSHSHVLSLTDTLTLLLARSVGCFNLCILFFLVISSTFHTQLIRPSVRNCISVDLKMMRMEKKVIYSRHRTRKYFKNLHKIFGMCQKRFYFSTHAQKTMRYFSHDMKFLSQRIVFFQVHTEFLYLFLCVWKMRINAHLFWFQLNFMRHWFVSAIYRYSDAFLYRQKHLSDLLLCSFHTRKKTLEII